MGKVIETVADSIAIEILDEGTILIGKGNELHLYSKIKENVFDTVVLSIRLTNKIHGIKKFPDSYENTLLVYGEKEFKLLEYNSNFHFCEAYRAELSDWISCGLFLNCPKEIVLLTAHSTILRFSYSFSERECCLKERISCTDNSTLYCAHLLGNKWSELVVFSGNAFGELLIWQPGKNEENQLEPLKPKVSPLIHRISAHNGVVFSIDYDQKSQCLVTTSDDRAVKWWKVIGNSTQTWNTSVLQPVSSGYGHVARVFRGRIIHDGPNVYALSVGEDSYFCLWNRNGELLFKRRHQYGAIIWNFVYDYISKTIYTIGSTGNLVAFDLNQVLKENPNCKEVSTLLPALTDDKSGEYIGKIKFVCKNHLIGVTNQNNLMSSRFNGEKWNSWKNASVKVNFKCTVLEVYDNITAICGYKHFILMEYEEKSGDFIVLRDEEVLKGVIRAFVFFSKENYLICDDQGNCVSYTNSIKRYLELPGCKEPWLTTALLLSQQQHIVISNRQGNLLLYQLQQDCNYYDLKHIIKHPHGNLGATCLKCLEEKSSSAIICSTGHDGILNVFSVDFCNNTIQICTRQITPVAWIECVEKCNRDIDLFLGFNDNHFVVWCREYDFLLQIPCGGGHRCWSFALNSKSENISVVFIKNKRVHFYKMGLFNKDLTTLPLAKRWHTASCNVVQILPQTSAYSHIAVTAGDDNLLKIHSFNKQTGLKELKELHSHISNVRCLKIISLNETEFLVFSGGGRAQLCVTKVNCSGFHINELINYTVKAKKQNNYNSEPYNFDPETRLMSLDVKVLNGEDYEIYVGCSDGFVRHLKLYLRNLEILLLAQHFYSKCILQIRYLNESDLILVAGTDGFLKIFDSNLSKCLHKLQHHYSGINGLSIFYNFSAKSLHILSGGDDQAVSYTELSLKDSDFQVIRYFRKPYLHTSQVCGCALSSNGLYGFTSGIDQILNKIDLSTGEVVDSFHSCVADIKGVLLINDDLCLLYGCGFQIYDFNS